MWVEVRRGDCLSSLAAAAGLLWEAVWEHPANADLRQLREDPNVLRVGDHVWVPPREPEPFTRETRRRHRFVLAGVPARLRVVFHVDGHPRAGETYTLDIDGIVTKGTLTGEGLLDVRIPPDARSGTLWLEGRTEPLTLQLGALEPHGFVDGVQQRLNNLHQLTLGYKGLVNLAGL